MNSYKAYLDKVVDTIFTAAYTKYTWEEWAAEAGVASSTVIRLGTRVTKRPQLRTVFLLAKAVDVDLPSVKTLRQKLKIRRVA